MLCGSSRVDSGSITQLAAQRSRSDKSTCDSHQNENSESATEQPTNRQQHDDVEDVFLTLAWLLMFFTKSSKPLPLAVDVARVLPKINVTSNIVVHLEDAKLIGEHNEYPSVEKVIAFSV